MNNNYYKPEIEEFHVGFEYEFHGITIGGIDVVDFSQNPPKTINSKKPDIKVWNKESIYRDDYALYNRSFKSLEELIKTNQIRVKYLDKEDIESLGFKQIGTHIYDIEYNDPRGIDNNIRILFRQGTSWVLITQGNEKSITTTLNDNIFSDWTTRFSGNIKNKSELKKLLVQLGVL